MASIKERLFRSIVATLFVISPLLDSAAFGKGLNESGACGGTASTYGAEHPNGASDDSTRTVSLTSAASADLRPTGSMTRATFGDFRPTATEIGSASIVSTSSQTTDNGQLLAQVSATDAAPYVKQLENNTRQILLKIIELERYNLKYRSQVAKQGRWKGWRYFISQETNNALSLPGLIVGTVERSQAFEKKSDLAVAKQLNRGTLERGNVLSGVAQIIGASGSMGEFAINAYHEVETHKKGFAPAAARKKVKGISSDISNLLAEREKIEMTMNANCEPSKYTAVAHAEEPILQDMRDISLEEFRHFHSTARRTLAFFQTLYLTDIARNALGVLGNRYGWEALTLKDRHLNSRAGVFFTLSGALTLANPFLSRAVGKVVGEYHKHYIKPCMEGAKPGDVEKLNQDIAYLNKVANAPELQNMDLPLLRCALYSEHENGVRSQLDMAGRELRAGVLTASENVISGTIIGSGKTAGGILFIIAGNKFPHSGRHSNELQGAANIVGVPSASYALLETLRIQLKREWYSNNLKKKNMLPSQIIKERLAKLDALEGHLLKNYKDNAPSTSMEIFKDRSLPLIRNAMQSNSVPVIISDLIASTTELERAEALSRARKPRH